MTPLVYHMSCSCDCPGVPSHVGEPVASFLVAMLIVNSGYDPIAVGGQLQYTWRQFPYPWRQLQYLLAAVSVPVCEQVPSIRPLFALLD